MTVPDSNGRNDVPSLEYDVGLSDDVFTMVTRSTSSEHFTCLSLLTLSKNHTKDFHNYI